jgi:hypothetical protein
MGLPEYAFSDDYVLTSDDLTAELLDGFEQHCARTERSMLADAFAPRPSRGPAPRKSPYDESGQYSDEAVFRDALSQTERN